MNERTGGSGSASSLLGLVQSLFGGLVTPLVGLAGETSAMPYITIICISGVILIILQIFNYFAFRNTVQ